MAIEIERKFRIVGESWLALVHASRRIRQAYLAKGRALSIRVRISGEDAATLTIKTTAAGIERHEYEYPIPVRDAEELMRLSQGVIIAKTRHMVPVGDVIFEIDVFEGENAGLVLAEVELDRVDRPFARPAWLGEEVTDDRRFYNAELAQHPFARW